MQDFFLLSYLVAAPRESVKDSGVASTFALVVQVSSLSDKSMGCTLYTKSSNLLLYARVRVLNTMSHKT